MLFTRNYTAEHFKAAYGARSAFWRECSTIKGGEPLNTNEKYISALVSCGSVRGAAAVLGVSPRRVATKLKDSDFRRQYEEAKSAVLNQTVAEIVGQLTAAVRTLATVAQDETAPQTVRVSACDSLLRHGLRYLEAADFERRLRAIEEIQNQKGDGTS